MSQRPTLADRQCHCSIDLELIPTKEELLKAILIEVGSLGITAYRKTQQHTLVGAAPPGMRAQTYTATGILGEQRSFNSVIQPDANEGVNTVVLEAQGELGAGEVGYVHGVRKVAANRAVWFLLLAGRGDAQDDVERYLEAFGLEAPDLQNDLADRIFVDLALRFVDWDSEDGMHNQPNTCECLKPMRCNWRQTADSGANGIADTAKMPLHG